MTFYQVALRLPNSSLTTLAMSASPQTPDAGYSIDLGNAASKNAYNWSKKTFATRAGLPGEPARDLDGGFRPRAFGHQLRWYRDQN
jgi:hypothetical protein